MYCIRYTGKSHGAYNYAIDVCSNNHTLAVYRNNAITKFKNNRRIIRLRTCYIVVTKTFLKKPDSKFTKNSATKNVNCHFSVLQNK